MIKTGKIFWGIILIAVAALIIVDAIGILAPIVGIFGGISLFRVVIGLGLVYYIISRLVKGKIGSIFIPLSFIFMLFERNIAYLCKLEDENIISNWLLFFCAVLISVGVSMISGNFKLVINTDGIHKKPAIGNSVNYIDSSDFDYQKKIENNLGSCNICFENPNQYQGQGTLHVENNLGNMNIFVPISWRTEVDIETNLGRTVQSKSGNPDGPRLRITGENNLGNITIHSVDR